MVSRRVLLTVSLLCLSLLPSHVHAVDPPRVVLTEVVTDPQRDWDGSGSVTSSDEYVVLHNAGKTPVELTGWRLVMDDSTPAEHLVEGTIGPGVHHVVLNPNGVMNNDVRLALLRPDDTVADEAELGADGTDDGNAADILDEAVYLHGPWTGSRAPATFGAGLAPVWVEALARAGGTSDPMQVPWVAVADQTLDLRLHVAPNWNGTPALTVDGQTVDMTTNGDGTWRTAPFDTAPPRAVLTVHADDEAVDTFPDGTALTLPVDAAAPRLAESADAVMNETRHLRWMPGVLDRESGVRDVTLSTTNATGADAPLEPCADPTNGPPTCPVDDNVTGVLISATDRVGNIATFRLGIQNDTAPPLMPDRFTFEPGVPPTFAWDDSSEPLASLAVETADDVGGTWNRTRVALTADADSFTDHAWRPGEPRAYRLVAADRGGHVNTSAWIALPPEAVPVQANATGLDAALDHLVDGAAGNVTVRFDRPLTTAPRLLLEADRPEPYRVATNASLAPDGQTAQYLFVPHGQVPPTGFGAWRFEGGQGADAAPVAVDLAPASWDVEPPRIVVSGVSDDWLARERHVVVVTAFDRGGGPTRLTVDAAGASVRSIGPATTEVAFADEGVHTVDVRAVDDREHVATKTVTLRLDATPPTLRLTTVPSDWSAAHPILLQASDAVSGIDTGTFKAQVRTAQGPHALDVEWNGSTVALRPTGATAKGPFALDVAIADGAGNRAHGTLGQPVAPAPLAVQVVVNGTASSDQQIADANQTVAPDGAQGQTAPMSGNPTTSWTELALPEPVASAGEHEEEGSGGSMTLAAGLVSAGLLGLGTVIHRKRSRPRTPRAAPGTANKEEGRGEKRNEAPPVLH